MSFLKIRLVDSYVCTRRASNSTRVKVDQTRLQGLGNCIAFISRYRYCWESGCTSGYRVPGVWPFAKLVGSTVSSSNFQCKRHPCRPSRDLAAPSFVSSQSHALSSSFKLYLCPPRFLVLPLLPFLPFLFDTLTLGKESRDIPDIFAFSDSTAGSILLGKFLSVVFCGEHRWDRGTWIKLPSGTRLVWYASKDFIDFDLAGCFFFFLLARFLFRPFHSNVHEEK